MTGSEAASTAGGGADDTHSSLRPTTSSVLAALAGRGVDLPGVGRPIGELAPGGATSQGDRVGDTGDPEVARYTVVDKLARGGMGVVLRVRDEDLRRELAMKVLDRADREADALASDPRDLARFLEEAQVTGQLDHPGVPPIHELGLARDGRLFFTMKLVRGGTFLEVINHVRESTEGWTVTRALGVVLKVCEALAYAHHKGVVHRDIKPANIMVGRFGETYVMDWGLAKVVDGAQGGDGRTSYDSMVSRSIVHTDRQAAVADAGSTHATLDGDVVGTPAYMAPEQARGDIDALGPHSDIYAVGALLYHLVSGQAPYLEPGVRVSPHSVLRWVIDGPPKPLADVAPGTPAELIAIIEKAMAREPGLRYTSMLDLAGDLQAFIEDRVVRAYQSGAWAEARKWVTRNKPLAAAAALLLMVTIGALGAVSWVQAQGRAEVEERNLLLGESNAALASANTQLEDKNVELAQTNAALDRQRSAAEQARAAAEVARTEAQVNADLARANAERATASAREAEANERRALMESYAANMTAAVAALEAGGGAAARRHLAACPEELRGWDWRHLSLRADPSLHVWKGADSLLHDVVHSPDGGLLATASGPYGNFGPPVREARLLDAATGETLLTLPADYSVRKVAFSPDGRLLAQANNRYVSLQDLERGRSHGSRHRIPDQCVALEFLDDDRLLVLSVDEDADSSRLDVLNVSPHGVLFSRTSSPAVTSATPTPDGARLVIGRSDYSVELWTLPDGEAVWSLPGIDVSGELAVATSDLPGITSLANDPRAQRLLVTDRDQLVRLLDARDGRELARRKIPGASPVCGRFHPDGPWVVVGDSSGSVRFLDSVTLDLVERLSGHDQEVTSLSISPDGDQLVSADLMGNLRVWDGRPGAASLVIANRASSDDAGSAVGRRSIEFSPDGRLVAWTASPKATLVADVSTGEVLYRLAEADSATAAIWFTPDGRRIVVKTEVEGLLTFDATDGHLLGEVPAGGHADWAAFDPSGSLLAVVESRTDQRIDLRVAESGVRAASLSGHSEPITDGEFTSDSQRLVTCALDGSLRVWDLRSGDVVQQIDGDDDFLRVQLFDNERRAVTTSLDPTRSGLSVWDLEAGELLAFHPARGVTLRGDLHPDETLWAGSSFGGAVSLWSLERGEMFSLPAGDYEITHARFDPTGTRLAAIDRAGHLFLWETVHPRERGAERREASWTARRVGEARALVDGLFEEHLLMERVIGALQGDARLPDDLREAAVREVRVRGDNGPWVTARAWERLLPAEVPDDQLAAAPQCVAAAEALLPTLRDLHARWEPYQDAWEPLIWALWVLGRGAEASQRIAPALDSGYSFNPNGPQIGLVLEALLTADAGDPDRAREQLADAREEYELALIDAAHDVDDLAATARLLAFAEERLGAD